MKISLITPARPTARSGNRNTAVRWARFLRARGYRVVISEVWDGSPVDMMIALHARRSHDSIKRFADTFPGRPLLLLLTGTDLYRDIRFDADAQQSLRLATHLAVLQPLGLNELDESLRDRTSVIYQSGPRMRPGMPAQRHFDVCVLGHLRDEKDPFRTAYALRHLPPSSRIRVFHIGDAMQPEMAEEARNLMRSEQRYHWLGGMPRWQARQRLAHCRLMVISSRMEGGANVICESLSAGVPVVASRIPGNVGMLGEDYQGYYPLGDEIALAELLSRCETEPEFLALLKRQCEERAALMTPQRESAALAETVTRALAASSPDVPGPRRRARKAA